MIAAAVVVASGSGAALLAASLIARVGSSRSHELLAVDAARVTGNIELHLAEDQTLVARTGAYIAGSPDSSLRSLRQWGTPQALARYPEIRVLGRAVLAADTAAGARRRAEGLSSEPGPTGSFACLSIDNVVSSGRRLFPAGHNFCSGSLRAEAIASRDSGNPGLVPFSDGHTTLIAAVMPIYRGGAVPVTVTERRAAFLGWVGAAISPQVLLREALVSERGLAVALRYAGRGTTASISSGPPPAGGSSVVTALGGGWSAWVVGPVASSSIRSNTTARLLLVGGIALAVLIASVLVIVSASRLRALRVAEDRGGELRRRESHNELTKLPNRVLAAQHVSELLADGGGGQVIVADLDLDAFKLFNDTFGHDVGDRLMRAVADRLCSAYEGEGTVFHPGGDEFLLVFAKAAAVSPEVLADGVVELVRRPFGVREIGSRVSITTSVGVAAGDVTTGASLLQHATAALREAKHAGGDCGRAFASGMDARVRRRNDLERDLRSALDAGQLRLVYQPIYELSDLAICGLEALLRWRHPSFGDVRPDEFVPRLETSGMINEVGRFALREACHQLSVWQSRAPGLRISVNVSARQLDTDAIVSHVEAALADHKVPPAALILEITETALVRNVDTTVRRLHELKSLGVTVAIDDFGTGYSSLAYLQRFPVDCLKIDRAFTERVDTSLEGRVLFHSLVELGKNLGLRTVAEGVETTQQLDRVRAEHVDAAQGFLFARPLEPGAIDGRLLGSLPLVDLA